QNVTSLSGSGVFQTVGGGSHYLATGSPWRNAGATNINPVLAEELKRLTTFPPVVCSNLTYSQATNFGPQAARDIDVPDLGYHYRPLDYAFGAVHFTNAAFTVSPD